MKIYIYFDNDELEDFAEPLEQAITEWLASGEEGTKGVRLVNLPPDSEEKALQQRVNDWDLGVVINTSKKMHLKGPLNFLSRLAKEQKLECVVGLFDHDSGEPENVCYFGFEEGRPDLFEIATYLGMKK